MLVIVPERMGSALRIRPHIGHFFIFGTTFILLIERHVGRPGRWWNTSWKRFTS